MRNYTALQGVRGRADYEEGACGAEGPARGGQEDTGLGVGVAGEECAL